MTERERITMEIRKTGRINERKDTESKQGKSRNIERGMRKGRKKGNRKGKYEGGMGKE